MITDADVKKLIKPFVTKSELKIVLRNELSRFATKRDLESNTEYIVAAMTEMTDSVIKRIDKVLDRTIINEDELQDHENRLRKIEDKVFVI